MKLKLAFPSALQRGATLQWGAAVLCLAAVGCGDDTTAGPATTDAAANAMTDASTSDASQADSGSASADATVADGDTSDAGAPSDTSDAATDASGATADAAADGATLVLSFSTNVYGPILSDTCGGCHGATADGGQGPGLQFGRLDMSTEAAAFAGLVGDGGGVPAAGSKCGDAGVERVVPGNATSSLLYNKVASNSGDGGTIVLADGGSAIFCGSAMPLHGAALGAANLATIHDWIQQGANP